MKITLSEAATECGSLQRGRESAQSSPGHTRMWQKKKKQKAHPHTSSDIFNSGCYNLVSRFGCLKCFVQFKYSQLLTIYYAIIIFFLGKAVASLFK